MWILKQNINEHKHKHDNLSEIEFIPSIDFIKTYKKLSLTSKELQRQNELKSKKPTNPLNLKEPLKSKKRKRDDEMKLKKVEEKTLNSSF